MKVVMRGIDHCSWPIWHLECTPHPIIWHNILSFMPWPQYIYIFLLVGTSEWYNAVIINQETIASTDNVTDASNIESCSVDSLNQSSSFAVYSALKEILLWEWLKQTDKSTEIITWWSMFTEVNSPCGENINFREWISLHTLNKIIPHKNQSFPKVEQG